MKITKLLFLSIISLMLISADKPMQTFDFRIRTITAGITLENLDDLNGIKNAITFLKNIHQQWLRSAGHKNFYTEPTRISH